MDGGAQKQHKAVRAAVFSFVVVCYLMPPFQRGVPALIGPELMQDLQLDAIDFGLLGMTFMWAFGLAQAPTGALLDRFGARRGLAVIFLLIAAGSFLFSRADSLWQVLAGRAVIAVASAGIMHASAKVIAAWYSRQAYRGMWALFMGLGTMGGIIATTPLAYMISRFGWRDVFLLLGGFCLFVAMVAGWKLQEQPDNIRGSDQMQGERQLAVQQSTGNTSRGLLKRNLKELTAQPKLWMASFIVLGVNAGGQCIIALWGGVYLSHAYGLPKAIVGEILLAAAVGMVCGCFGVGALLQRFNTTYLMLRGAVLFFVAWLYMTLFVRALGVLELKVLMALLGFFEMVVVVSNFAFVKELVKPSQLATAMGINNGATWVLGAGLFQQLWAVIINVVSQGKMPYPIEAFQTAFWLQAVVLLLGVLAAKRLGQLHTDACGAVAAVELEAGRN